MTSVCGHSFKLQLLLIHKLSRVCVQGKYILQTFIDFWDEQI